VPHTRGSLTGNHCLHLLIGRTEIAWSVALG
jgi:hypothetical protein